MATQNISSNLSLLICFVGMILRDTKHCDASLLGGLFVEIDFL